jgi:hypothetical protein
MTLHAPESDASKTRRRPGKTERRADDCESAALDCPSVTFVVRGALSKQEGAFTKRNVALSIQDVAFSSARATLSIRNGALVSPARLLRNHVTLSQFIGRRYRFKASPFLRRRATKYSRRHVHDSLAANCHEKVRPPTRKKTIQMVTVNRSIHCATVSLKLPPRWRRARRRRPAASSPERAPPGNGHPRGCGAEAGRRGEVVPATLCLVDAESRRRLRAATWSTRVYRSGEVHARMEADDLEEWARMPARDRVALCWTLSRQQVLGEEGVADDAAVSGRLPRSAYRVEPR